MGQKLRNDRVMRDRIRQLEQIRKRGITVYGAQPFVHPDTRIGCWNFTRGTVASIEPQRSWRGRVADATVTIDDPVRGSVEILASQLRWRDAEAFTTTPVNFSTLAMNVRDQLAQELALIEAQLNNEKRRPYDFSFKDATDKVDRIKADIEALPRLADDLFQLAEALEREFSYPQQQFAVHGSRDLHYRLAKASMGRLPFYQQLALLILDRWVQCYGKDYAYRGTWEHPRDTHTILPNIAYYTINGCAVGPDASVSTDITAAAKAV